MGTWACTACGGENPEGMKFCGHCGTPAAASAAPAAPPPPPAPTADDTLRAFVSSPVAERIVETGGALAEERRLITALFADISGFTALAQRVDTEQLLEIIDPVVARLSSIVGRYEGYVEKFAGDALLALFGAPVSHEDDAERALRVALEMHEELARIREELPEEASGLTLHVGINSGHGIARILGSEARMDYAVLGDSVILAQRLESQTPSGETYVGATTVQLARGRFHFEPVGELEVKGKAEPVPAWRLVGPVVLPLEVTSPGTVEPARATTLVGRGRELAALVAAFEGDPGRGGLLAVSGEPGIGKSTLVSALASTAAERGMRWLSTRCVSYGATLAYRPIAELVRLRAAVQPDDQPNAAAAKLHSAFEADGAGEAVPFVGRLIGLPDEPDSQAWGLEPEAFRRALHDRVVGWLKTIAAAQPVVVLVEDAHWADRSSIDLLREAAAAVGTSPIYLCITSRPEGLALTDELAGAVAEGGTAVQVRLEPLDDAGVGEMVEELLGSEPPAGLVGPLAERSGGNPYFVEEIVRALREDGSLVIDGAGWQLRAGWAAADVPPTVEGVLAARLDRLPAATARVLQVGAVIGRRVRDALLRGVVPDEPQLDGRVATLVDAGLFDRGLEGGQPVLTFHHALVQDVAYGRLLRRQRREYHRRVATVAESLYGAGDDTIDLLARHWWLADVGAAAIDYLVRAAERSRRLFANAEAIAWFERAVEIARKEEATGGRLPSLLLDLAELRELVGDYEAALPLYREVVEETGSVRAWQGVASVLRRKGAYDEALSTLDVAFAALDRSGEDLRGLWLERGWSLSLGGHFNDAISAFGSGLESANGRARDAVTARLLLELARTEGLKGRYDEALDRGAEAQRLFEELADSRGLATALRTIGHFQAESGQPDVAAASLRRALELAERTGTVEEVAGALINLGILDMELGEFDEAIEDNRRAITEFERIGHGAGRATGYANLAQALMLAGRFDEALVECTKAIELGQAIGHALTVADGIETLAKIRLRLGAHAEAGELAEQAAAAYVEMEADQYARDALALAADAWRRAGNDERAESVEHRLR